MIYDWGLRGLLRGLKQMSRMQRIKLSSAGGGDLDGTNRCRAWKSKVEGFLGGTMLKGLKAVGE